MKRFCALLVLFFFPLWSFGMTQWKEIAPGISYTNIVNKESSKDITLGNIHAFKINLQKNELKLALAKDSFFPASTVKWLAEENHALLAINGGFFTPVWQPLGLRIQYGKIRSFLQPTSWWHIFYIKGNIPYIISEKDYQVAPPSPENINIALQGGPRLLNNGNIPPLKAGKEERSALGITRDGRLIILATEHWRISTTKLAKIMKASEEKGGLNCIQALNLDGGSSTQLYAKIGALNLDISSFSLITDILYVVPK